MATLTSIEDARHEFEVSLEEIAADMGVEADDAMAADMLSATAMNCDKATAYELCTTEIGWIPQDVISYFRGARAEQPEPWLWEL